MQEEEEKQEDEVVVVEGEGITAELQSWSCCTVLPTPTRSALDIGYVDLSLKVRAGGPTVLKGVTGRIRPGRVTAVRHSITHNWASAVYVQVTERLREREKKREEK